MPTCLLRVASKKGSCAMKCSQVTYHRSAESRNSKLRGLQSSIGELARQGSTGSTHRQPLFPPFTVWGSGSNKLALGE